MHRTPGRTTRHTPGTGETDRGVRFAFYGRISTRNHQDRFSSSGWQREAAETLITGRGTIVAEFFDTGCSRRLPWHRRRQAAALLAALDEEDRGFEAIVVGEYERAFTDTQLTHLLPLLQRHGVQLWLPEAGGPVDATNPAHPALMTMARLRDRGPVAGLTATRAAPQFPAHGRWPPPQRPGDRTDTLTSSTATTDLLSFVKR